MRIGIDASLTSLRGTGTGRYASQLLGRVLDLDRDNEYVLYFRRRDVGDNPLLRLRRRHVRLEVTDAPSTLARLHVNLALALRRDRVDLYHSLGYFVPWLWRGKSVVTIHDIHTVLLPQYCNQPGTRISYVALRTHIPVSLRRATRIVTPSEYTRQTICRRFEIPEARIVVAPAAPDPFFFGEASREELDALALRFGSGAFFLHVGALAPMKNVTGLLEAFARFRRRAAGRSMRLVLVGVPAGVHWARSLRPLIARLDLTDAVVHERYVDDAMLRALYQRATALILPSFAEGFGLPVVEAMACGTAVVISDIPALREVAGAAALAIDPHDPDDLAQAMERVLTEPGLRETLAASGRQRAASFSWDRTARRTLEVYAQT